MKITFITGNTLKFAEITAILPDVVQIDIDLPEIQELDPKKIIEAKLESAVLKGIFPVMVEDTSLYLDSMNGLPGPLIKWFLNAIGTKGLYEMAERSGNTHATAKTVIGVAFTANDFQYFEGYTKGMLVTPKGKEFGWNSIFLPAGADQTFGEMSPDKRLTLSMRRFAALKLLEYLNTK